jgi:hypothetical protein
VFDNLKNTGNPTNDIRPNPAPPFGDPTWNPEYHPDGYVYGIVVPQAPATVTVELYDASCDTDASDTAGDFNCLGQTPTDFQLYDLSGHAGVVAPPSNAFSGCRKVAASNDATYRNRWTTLCTFRTNTAGTYPLRVRTDDIPVDQPSGFAGCSFTDVRTPSGCVGNGVNAFAIRASGTPGVTVTPLDAGSMWLDPNASIDLADIEPATTDRLLAVDVFDPGDGSLGSSPPFAAVSLSQPNPTTGSQLGVQPVPACVWMGSDVRGGPNVQSGASDLCSITTFNTTSRPFSKFNNQWLRIVVPIPAGYTCPPASDACWWRLRYSGPMADRLSYTARIVGDVIP